MARWSDEDLKQLEDPDTWDGQVEQRSPVKNQRSVVSVAFAREDYERVAQAARHHGMKTSEFIRNAALRQAQGSISISGAVTIADDRGGFRRVAVTVPSRVFEVTNQRDSSYTR
jgi:hypothetical protein